MCRSTLIFPVSCWRESGNKSWVRCPMSAECPQLRKMTPPDAQELSGGGQHSNPHAVNHSNAAARDATSIDTPSLKHLSTDIDSLVGGLTGPRTAKRHGPSLDALLQMRKDVTSASVRRHTMPSQQAQGDLLATASDIAQQHTRIPSLPARRPRADSDSTVSSAACKQQARELQGGALSAYLSRQTPMSSAVEFNKPLSDGPAAQHAACMHASDTGNSAAITPELFQSPKSNPLSALLATETVAGSPAAAGSEISFGRRQSPSSAVGSAVVAQPAPCHSKQAASASPRSALATQADADFHFPALPDTGAPLFGSQSLMPSRDCMLGPAAKEPSSGCPLAMQRSMPKSSASQMISPAGDVSPPTPWVTAVLPAAEQDHIHGQSPYARSHGLSTPNANSRSTPEHGNGLGPPTTQTLVSDDSSRDLTMHTAMALLDPLQSPAVDSPDSVFQRCDQAFQAAPTPVAFGRAPSSAAVAPTPGRLPSMPGMHGSAAAPADHAARSSGVCSPPAGSSSSTHLPEIGSRASAEGAEVGSEPAQVPPGVGQMHSHGRSVSSSSPAQAQSGPGASPVSTQASQAAPPPGTSIPRTPPAAAIEIVEQQRQPALQQQPLAGGAAAPAVSPADSGLHMPTCANQSVPPVPCSSPSAAARHHAASAGPVPTAFVVSGVSAEAAPHVDGHSPNPFAHIRNPFAAKSRLRSSGERQALPSVSSPLEQVSPHDTAALAASTPDAFEASCAQHAAESREGAAMSSNRNQVASAKQASAAKADGHLEAAQLRQSTQKSKVSPAMPWIHTKAVQRIAPAPCTPRARSPAAAAASPGAGAAFGSAQAVPVPVAVRQTPTSPMHRAVYFPQRSVSMSAVHGSPYAASSTGAPSPLASPRVPQHKSMPTTASADTCALAPAISAAAAHAPVSSGDGPDGNAVPVSPGMRRPMPLSPTHEDAADAPPSFGSSRLADDSKVR